MGATGAQATTDMDFTIDGTFILALDLVSASQQKRIHTLSLIIDTLWSNCAYRCVMVVELLFT